MHPLFDFRYYNYPFNKSTIDTMPWHWKEAILQDLETSNGEYSDNMEQMITNFYGDTVYEIFYKNYFLRMFGTEKILTDWYRPYMRDVHTNFNHYTEEYIKFPIDQGWNNLFSFFTKDVDVRLDTPVTIKSFSPDDTVIVTTEVDKFLEIKSNLYSHGSFDIDSTPYKENSPDTLIYPNYTPYLTMTQFGKYYKIDGYGNPYEKNILVKMFVDDGDIPLYPIPTKKNKKIYNDIINDQEKKINYPNIIFAGRSGSWSFMDMDGVMDQAQRMSAKIKHSKRRK
jgi:UDP-galactopyranose mutase